MVLAYFAEAFSRAGVALLSYSTLIVSVIIAVLCVAYNSNGATITSVIVTALVTALIFLLLTSTSGDDPQGALPSTTYPVPPHLGLDGVNLQNRWNNEI